MFIVAVAAASKAAADVESGRYVPAPAFFGEAVLFAEPDPVSYSAKCPANYVGATQHPK